MKKLFLFAVMMASMGAIPAQAITFNAESVVPIVVSSNTAVAIQISSGVFATEVSGNPAYSRTAGITFTSLDIQDQDGSGNLFCGENVLVSTQSVSGYLGFKVCASASTCPTDHIFPIQAYTKFYCVTDKSTGSAQSVVYKQH